METLPTKMMKEIHRTVCSDPYQLGCRSPVIGAIPGVAVSGLDGSQLVPITINFCTTCSSWNSDWDWDLEPQGPFLAKPR